MNDEQKKIIKETRDTINDFTTGYLEADMGYKFRTRDFLNVIFLYINSVDVKNPDILGRTNKNTFIYEVQDAIEKIKEQIRLDIKDIGFLVNGASSLGRFVVKSANRKLLKENQFAKDLDDVADNSVDFGSGFLKIWKDGSGKLKLKSKDPYKIYFDQYNFTKGIKVEKLDPKTYKEILLNEDYDDDARNLLSEKIGGNEEELKKKVNLYQMAKPNRDGGNDIAVVDLENDIVLFSYEGNKDLEYYKFDYKHRPGFPDALGVGANEKVFNVIVQTKLNRARMDKVMEIASKMPFQKEIDPERDNVVGKEMTKIKDGVVLGHKGNPISALNLGGDKQVAFISNELNGLIGKAGKLLNVGEALAGNTLPSGTSGALGNLLTENSSSVLKEVKKHYAQFISMVYDLSIKPYILQVFKKNINLEKYLDKNDIKLIQKQTINYLVALDQIDAQISGEEFNEAASMEKAKATIKNKGFESGELLGKMIEEVEDIEVFISGEKKSKAQTVAFLREMRMTYAQNPGLFKSPFFVDALKREAEFESGVSGVEIDEMIELLDQEPEESIPGTPPAPIIQAPPQ